MTFRVVHRTAYAYDEPVSASYGLAHLLPRDLPGQVVRAASLVVEPTPEDAAEHVDAFGNRTSWFALRRPHTELVITATSLVDVAAGADARLVVDPPWETVRDALSAAGAGGFSSAGGPVPDRAGGLPSSGSAAPPDPELLAAVPFTLPSPQIGRSGAAAAYAVPSFRPGRPLLEATLDLASRIHRDITFKPGVTAVGTPVEEVLAARAGVCQDLAHLAVAALRSAGLAARYVSGYLETDPPPGRPRLVGADVSHAWVSVFVPQTGWVDVDPTNDQLVGDRYVTVAWGRDYGDVTPVAGVIFTDGMTTSLEVAVDVRRLAQEVGR